MRSTIRRAYHQDRFAVGSPVSSQRTRSSLARVTHNRRARLGDPKRASLRSLRHPPAANPLGSRWGWGGDTATISPPASNRCRQSLPCARGGGGKVKEYTDGATEVTPSSEVMNGRKRRGSNPHLQNLSMVQCRVPVLDFRISHSDVPRWPSRREATPRSRYRSRARRLAPEQEFAIRALAGTRSLRSLAADFGVSHETIRAVVRQHRLSPD